jgi:DNA-binding XRE family transcriptional regulator
MVEENFNRLIKDIYSDDAFSWACNNLEAAMNSAGHSNEKAAEEIGVDRSTIWRHKTNRTRSSIPTIRQKVVDYVNKYFPLKSDS